MSHALPFLDRVADNTCITLCSCKFFSLIILGHAATKLTLLHSEGPKLHRVLAILSAIWLKNNFMLVSFSQILGMLLIQVLKGNVTKKDLRRNIQEAIGEYNLLTMVKKWK